MINEYVKLSEDLSANEITLLKHLIDFKATFYLDEAYSSFTSLMETKSLFYELFFGLQMKSCIYIVKDQPKTESSRLSYALTGIGKRNAGNNIAVS